MTRSANSEELTGPTHTMALSPSPATGRGIWIGSIVVDCTHLTPMIEFWREALHYVPRDPPRPDGVILKDPGGRGPNLNLSLGTEGPLDDYRLHLDLYSTDPLADVERLLRLGATMNRPADKDHDFVTLADPDGNLFDVIDVNWPADGRDWEFGRRP
jgi:Glyoxalase-like domain